MSCREDLFQGLKSLDTVLLLEVLIQRTRRYHDNATAVSVELDVAIVAHAASGPIGKSFR